MKKNLFIMSILLIVVIITLCGCELEIGKENTDKKDYTQIYSKTLDRYYDIITNYTDEYELKEEEEALSTILMDMGKNKILESLGYNIQDISGDGIPELIIGYIIDNNNSKYYGKQIYAAYTCVNNEPKYIFNGHTRNNYTLIDQGMILNEGSAGAIYSIFGTYTLSKDGTELSCKDYYFTHEKDNNYQDVRYYHNTTGKWDTSVSEELKISQEEYWNMQESLEKKAQSIELTPFSQYKTSNKNVNTLNTEEGKVYVQYAKEVLNDKMEYIEFNADTSEYQEKVLFSTNGSVSDFKVLALTYKNVDDNGNLSFSTKQLYSTDKLTSEKPLVVGMTFNGTIPNYGISYVDDKGVTKNFAVGMSGENGSVLLTEF